MFIATTRLALPARWELPTAHETAKRALAYTEKKPHAISAARIAGSSPESEGAGICPAVDQPVLPGDVARLLAAQPGAGSAELVAGAEAARRHRRDALGARLLDRDLLCLG